MSDSVLSEISWTPVLERYFAETGEKSEGLSWMHGESELIFTGKRTWIDLPVIIGSGVVGFLNAGSSSLFSDPVMASIALGIGSLSIGILNTLGSYYAFARRAEGHRIASLSYAKLSRFLRVELGLPRDERMRPGDLLKMIKTEIDRLSETAPPVPPDVRDKFRKRFRDVTVAKPEIANGLHPVTVFVDTPSVDLSQMTVESQAIAVPHHVDGRPRLILRSAKEPSSEGQSPSAPDSVSPTDESHEHS